MAIKVEITCPLGSDCEVVVDNVIKRCAWYTKLTGTDPSTGKDVDEWGCSMSFMPMLMVLEMKLLKDNENLMKFSIKIIIFQELDNERNNIKRRQRGND